MSEDSFHFRQFCIHQDKCAMKVGTDAVLLGSWIKTGTAKRILDIGTGTGVIALMLAQKSNAMIDAIDIDENAWLQSKQNFISSPWFDRMHSRHISFQCLVEEQPESYDLIVTNPPYFHHASKPIIPSRLNARHNEALTFDDLVSGVKKLLTPAGKFCLILPAKEGMEFLDKAQVNSLFCHHLVRVKTKADKCEKRFIMEFGFRFGLLTEEEIILQREDSAFTEDYINLTQDYYIQLRQMPTAFQQI